MMKCANVYDVYDVINGKKMSHKIVYNEKKIQISSNEYAIYLFSSSEKKYFSFVALALMKYAYFLSLYEINDLFIQKF